MSVGRRTFLKVLGGGAATVGTASVAQADVDRSPKPESYGMLFDVTRCIGCKNCVHACADANGLQRETTNGLHHNPIDLSWSTKNVIKMVQRDERGVELFVKRQCMHCADPGCASACMMGALHKDKNGVVAYDQDRCMGCRYCQIACPFNVPKFEWTKRAPIIVKCELCRHRYAEGKGPACCEICPAEAVVFGNRAELLADAKKRIADKPDAYEDHVYGETEAGGTQVLYLTKKGLSFASLGLPAPEKIGTDPAPGLVRSIQHGIYKGFIAPIVLYVALGVAVFKARKAEQKGGEG